MKLKDMTEVAADNAQCVVLKVKPGHELDLITLGCFAGNETMFRLTKGPTITCTVFHADGKQFSWYWGFDGYMLVSPQVAAMGRLIQACIERDFHIPCKQ